MAGSVPAGPARPGGGQPGAAQSAVRRVIVYGLLFAVVVITTTGIAGLVGRLFEGTSLAAGGAGDLALWLAFTLIGGPLGGALWWALWRRLGRDESERASLAWGLYVTAVYLLALVVATTTMTTMVTTGLSGQWRPADLGTGLAWTAVWFWHRWMLRHPLRSPRRLASVPGVLAATFGLVYLAVGSITALGSLLREALATATSADLVSTPWWQGAVGALISGGVGLVIWWWHWVHDEARSTRTVFSAVALVVVGVAGGAAAALIGLGTALWCALRVIFDDSQPLVEMLSPLGTALAATTIGGLIWVAHHRVAVDRSSATRRAAALVVAGLGLVGVATGLGIVVNATLGALVSPLVAADTRSLLLGGIATLVVGAPVWWAMWQPRRRFTGDEITFQGRRIYLVAVFGASAVVALIALLVVGSRLFEFLLDATTASSLVDRVRAPLGLLLATVLVFTYHFAVWRQDRATISAEGLAPVQRIGRVTLVAPDAAPALARAIEATTGASVEVWPVASPGVGSVSASADAPVVDPWTTDAAALSAAFADVTARHVLVLAGPEGRFEIIPLAG